MKLITNFQELLDADQLPRSFHRWWLIEEEDKCFQHNPFEGPVLGWQYLRLRCFFKDAKTSIGFFRKSSSKADRDLQKILLKQFDEELIYQMHILFTHKEELRSAKDHINDFKCLYKSGMTGVQIRDEFERIKRLNFLRSESVASDRQQEVGS